MFVHVYYRYALILSSMLFFGLSLLEPPLLPLRLIASAVLTAGMFGVFQAFGLSKPLNLFAAVAWAYGAAAQLLFVLLAVQAAGVVYIVAWLIALFLISASALHRDRRLKQTGALGIIGTSLPLVAIIAGHIALGGFGVLATSAGAGNIELIWAEAVICAFCFAVGLFFFFEADSGIN